MPLLAPLPHTFQTKKVHLHSGPGIYDLKASFSFTLNWTTFAFLYSIIRLGNNHLFHSLFMHFIENVDLGHRTTRNVKVHDKEFIKSLRNLLSFYHANAEVVESILCLFLGKEMVSILRPNWNIILWTSHFIIYIRHFP